jgi:hypothetical protein
VPKWLAWYGIWVGFSFIAEILMPFFMDGLFARHGVLNFWIEFFLWFFWIVGLSYYIFVAIGRLEAEAQGISLSAHTRGAITSGAAASASA